MGINAIITIGAFVLLALGLNTCKVDAKDVVACQESTGWSEDRCYMEIMR